MTATLQKCGENHSRTIHLPACCGFAIKPRQSTIEPARGCTLEVLNVRASMLAFVSGILTR